MQIRDYWLVFTKRWWLILLVGAVAGAVALGYSRLQTPIYRSNAFLLVSPSRLDYGLTLVIKNLLRQYSRQIETDKLAQTVSDRLRLDISPEELRRRVKVISVDEDFLLQIQVDDTDPNRAYDIAFVLSDEFVKMQQIRMAPVDPRDRIEVTPLDKPTPGILNWPKTRETAMAGVLLGLIVGVLLAFLLEYMDDTIKTSDDVERYTALATLGSIPEANSHHRNAEARSRQATTAH
ncbi:MAG: Wzz/FepE/Etk N-terminal domain-containing protein [Bacteroidetes bacterium]|nr:Wzz/FepE/Etk N-terminal domain-containing protein [Bacteroidota bacterium]